MLSHSFISVINRPKRVRTHTAILVDYIFTNTIDSNKCISGILFSDNSDHFPVFYLCKARQISKNKKRIVHRRSLMRKEYPD